MNGIEANRLCDQDRQRGSSAAGAEGGILAVERRKYLGTNYFRIWAF